MILSGGTFLRSTRINAILRDQAENYQRRMPLRFLDRTASVPADDEEIIGTYTGRVMAADLIADDQAAVVYDAGQFEFATYAIPNLKAGKRISQAMMCRIHRMDGGGNVGRDEVGIFENYEAMLAADVRRGVEERINALICAMWMDAGVYNRLGIQLNVNWGTPAAYKVTPVTPWTNPASTPVTDILTLKEYAQATDGESFDRLTLGRADFRLMVQTTEFRNNIQGIFGQPLGATSGAYSPYDTRMEGFASQILGMDIEFEDKNYSETSPAGVVTASRVLPLGKVLLSTKSDDNNPTSMDWANAIVGESIAAGIVGNNDTLGGPQYGPVAYYTGNENLNPPNVLVWGVSRGFPRKHRKTATACLTVR